MKRYILIAKIYLHIKFVHYYICKNIRLQFKKLFFHHKKSKDMINYNFKQMTDAQLLTRAGIIVQCITTETSLVSLKPQGETLKTLTQSFSVAVADARLRGTDRTSVKDACRNQVIDELNSLGKNLEGFSHGDENIEKLGGFETRKAPSSKENVLLLPPIFTIINTPRSGEVKLSWKSVEGSVNYAIEFRKKGETTWQNGKFTTKREILLSDLEPGTYMEFRIQTLGRGESKSDWSSIVGIWIA